MKAFLKRLFCRHEYKWQRKVSLFHALNGEEHVYRCSKCGKIKERKWVEYR